MSNNYEACIFGVMLGVPLGCCMTLWISPVPDAAAEAAAMVR